jgi:hypothetical protein
MCDAERNGRLGALMYEWKRREDRSIEPIMRKRQAPFRPNFARATGSVRGTYGIYGRGVHRQSFYVLILPILESGRALGETPRGRVTYVSLMCHLWHVWTDVARPAAESGKHRRHGTHGADRRARTAASIRVVLETEQPAPGKPESSAD